MIALVSGAGRWLRANLGGGTKDFLDNEGARKHEKDLEEVDKKLDDWRKDIDRIDEDAKVRPPKLSDVSTRDLVIVGGTAGAVVGAGVGSLSGLASTWLDDPKVDVQWTEHKIVDPTLKGFTDSLTPDTGKVPIYDGNGNVVDYRESVKGNFHRFTPQIEYREVGEWKEPKATLTHTSTGSSAVAEGLKGMVIGGLLGAGVGAAVAVARRATGQVPGPNSTPPREVDDQGKVIAVAAAGGAVIGGGLGLLSGLLEKAHTNAQTVKWEVPVVQQKEIGQIPQDHYHSIFDTTHEADIAKRSVTAEGPAMHRGLFGMRPDMQDRSIEVGGDPRFSVTGQVVGGAVLGAMGGVAAGVAVNVMRKYI